MFGNEMKLKTHISLLSFGLPIFPLLLLLTVFCR